VKKLIVTADDVGLHRGMTDGAIRAHQEGIVTACSVVANGAAFDDAAARLRGVPKLEVGVHLALVEERALTTGQVMPKNYARFLLSRKRNVEAELRAQIEKVLAAGLRVTHLNGHQHLHMLPSISAIVTKLAAEYRIGYVRRVNDRGITRRRLAMFVLNRLGRRAGGTNVFTIGVSVAGHLRDVEPLLDFVPEGVTELVAHPGVAVNAYPHWDYEWDAETRALSEPRLRDALHRRGIELASPSQVRASMTSV
jgi:predicted glycoside hydrolase/deacetylase ChbG (UPF0249 family)